MYIQRNIEALSRNHFCCGKAVSVKHSDCMFVCVCVFGSLALVIGRAKRMRRVMLSPVACVAAPNFPTLSKKKGTIFEKRLRNIK
jgi:hypothetical protein